MAYVKISISLHPDILEALDKVAKAQMDTKSHLISQALVNYPDIYEVLEGIRAANKAVSNE